MLPDASILGDTLSQPGVNDILKPPTVPQPSQQPATQPSLQYRRFGDTAKTRQLIFDNILRATQEIQPASNPRYNLGIENPGWKGPETFSLADQKQAILSGGTLSRRLSGDLVLRDAAGNEVSRRNTQLARVPYMTERGTFILNGTEYGMSSQMRLRPGVFTRRKSNKELEAHVNVKKGLGHRVFLDPQTGIFRIQMGQAKLPLLPLLKAMGVPESEIRNAWGNELTAKNMAQSDARVMEKLHQKLFRDGTAPEEDKHAAVVSAFKDMTLDPEVTKRTLGTPHENVGPETMMAITQKLLRVSRGEDEPDDRDSLAFQTFLGPEDLITDRLRKAKSVLRQMLWKASASGNLDRVPNNPYDESIRGAIMSSGLSSPLEEINPLEIFDQQSRVTRMGEGGIASIDAVPEESRAVSPSQLGFIDTIRTPESEKVGVDSRLARAAVKGEDGTIYTTVKTRDGQTQYKSPTELAEAVVAFPGELRRGAPYVAALANNRVSMVPRDQVQYEIPDMEGTFSPVGNLVPLKSMVKGQRGAMAARMLLQALPLRNAEAPLVQSGMPGGGNRSFEEEYAPHVGAIRAEVSGRVTAVTPGNISILTDTGEKQDIPLYDNFPFARKTFTHQTSLVQPGDVIKPGQLLAKSNFTDQNGAIALGMNARTAFTSWRGSVASDTHVLWYCNGEPRFTEVSDVARVDGVEAIATDPVTLDSRVHQVSGFCEHGAKKLLCVKTSSGRILRATPAHSFVILDDSGNLIEVQGKDLVPGVSWIPRHGKIDLPVRQTHVRIPAAGNHARGSIDVPLDFNFGFICGMYAAEGYVAANKGVNFAATDHKTREALMRVIATVFTGLSAKPAEYVVNFFDSRFSRWIAGEGGRLAHRKHVPGCIFGSPLECRKGFIAGFWTGDGRVHDKQGVPCDTDTLITSRILRDGLGLLLASIGVSTTHGEYDDPKCTYGKAYRLGVSTRDAHKLPDISWCHTTKGDRLKAVISSYKDNGSADHVPFFADAIRPARDAICGMLTGLTGAQAIRGYRESKTAPSQVKAYNRLSATIRRKTTIARRDAILLHERNPESPALQRLRQFSTADLEWDRVVAITEESCTKPVYDFDMAPLRTFTCVDTLVVHNSNFEDAIVISKSFANKMTSEHAYHNAHEWEDKDHRGLKAFRSVFATEYPKKVLENFDDDGVVKTGTKVSQGDPLILIARERERNRKSILQGNKPSFMNASEVWDHAHDGVVTDVVKTGKGVSVIVKSESPMEVGDKLAGRHGNKGIVAYIADDDEMPANAEGQPYEVLLNPLGLTSRGNPAQIVEAALGKVAAKRGQPIKVPDFEDEEDLVEYALGELQKEGLSDTETIVDPTNGRKIPDIFTGNYWLMKLHHQAESKAQGRGLGAYTADGTPAKSGTGDSSKRVGMMELGALLSHGVPDVIRDVSLVRGQANPQLWSQYMSGFKLPTPRVPFVYNKFVNSLRASGMNVVRDGQKMHIMALTDRDIDELAGDRELKNVETVNWRNMQPVPGGLFDPGLTGGHMTSSGGGQKWSYIKLREPLPSPVMEEPIRRILGLTVNQFNDVIAGKRDLHGKTGTQAISAALDNLDLDKEIDRARAEFHSNKKTARDAAARRMGYLKSASRLNIHPRDWMLSKVPVLPPAFRPVSTMGANKLPLVDDANMLYKELWDANKVLGDITDKLGEQESGDERLATYQAFKAVTGLGDPTHPKNQERKVKGILGHVFSSSPKYGVMQRRLLGSSVDLVGRAVVAPDPDLDMDQVAVPENQAWSIYRPVIIRRLVRRGMPRLQAARAVEEKSQVARQALLDEMDEGVILVNRAPTLHRFGIMAARPKLTKGNTLKVSPLTVGGFGMDFDGNCVTFSTEVTLEFAAGVLQETAAGAEFFQRLQETVSRLSGTELRQRATATNIRVTLPIGEVPRVGTPVHDRRGSEVYSLPDGITICSYDHATPAVVRCPITRLTVDRNHTCVRVLTARGREVEVSDNESLAVFDNQAGDLVKIRPADAVGKWIPVIHRETSPGSEFDRDIGWWYASLAADGWVTDRTVGYAKLDDMSRAEFIRIARQSIHADFTCPEYIEEKTEQKFSNSAKVHLNGKGLAAATFNCYTRRGPGRGALYKKLPDELLARGSRECLCGVLSGLLDGDRSIGWGTPSPSTAKPRLKCRFNTSSLAMVSSLQTLGRYLGIRMSVTYVPAKGKINESFVVCPSLIDMQALVDALTPVSPRTIRWVNDLRNYAIGGERRDQIPIQSDAIDYLSALALAAGDKNMYAALRKGRSDRAISRDYGSRALSLLRPGVPVPPSVNQLAALVTNTDVHWDRVKSVEPLASQDVFDFEVPATKVFMLQNGLIIYDTVNYHVPVTEEAKREALEKMLPSKNLLSPATFRVHQLPSQEYIGGLYEASARVDKQNRPMVFATTADAIRAYRQGRISADRQVEILNR